MGSFFQKLMIHSYCDHDTLFTANYLIGSNFSDLNLIGPAKGVAAWVHFT